MSILHRNLIIAQALTDDYGRTKHSAILTLTGAYRKHGTAAPPTLDFTLVGWLAQW